MRFVLYLIPEPWRSRYEDEVAHALAPSDRKLRDSLDLIAWGVKLRLERDLYKSVAGIALVTAFILLVPLVAMQVTDEVAWGPVDFVFAGVLIFGTGMTYELVARRAGNIVYRFAVGVALAAAFILIWANLAVGLIGSEEELANLMYIGVLAVGIIGALIARLQSRGMARALFATALAQALVTVIALVSRMHQLPESSVFEILGVNGFFVALWVGSAWLFRQAARKQPPDPDLSYEGGSS
jgi:hypothetical protein